MSTEVTMKRNISEADIEKKLLIAWKRVGRRILDERIEPHAPRRSGALRASLRVETEEVDGDVVNVFSAGVSYARLYEDEPGFYKGVSLTDPRARAPFIKPALEEKETLEIIEEELKEGLGEWDAS